jgi:thymidylate synthase (FAD)
LKTTNTCRVALVDSMGNDLRVMDAARVADHDHWTPFAHVMVTLRIACPVFIARQWFRHTIGVARNEVSRRYVDDDVQYFLPDEIRARPDASIKQGSGGKHPKSDQWRDAIDCVYTIADCLYEEMIADGVAPEQARMVLPLAHMTEFYETASLAFYGRVAGLRLDPHAQEEVRDLRELIDSTIQPIAPAAWQALRSYDQNSRKSFRRRESVDFRLNPRAEGK